MKYSHDRNRDYYTYVKSEKIGSERGTGLLSGVTVNNWGHGIRTSAVQL
jgi:hypothetical protein